MVTFNKLHDGSWGLRGTKADGMVAGAMVDVEKKDGTRARVTVGRIVATFPDGGVLAAIGAPGDKAPAPKAKASKAAPKAGAATKAARALKHKGRYECDECGDFVNPGTSCWETGATH